MQTEHTKAPSRRARIILWTTLAAGLLAILATPIAIFASLRYRASQKRANIEALKELGEWVSERPPNAPEWLVTLFGEENFTVIDAVHAGRIEATYYSSERHLSRADTEEFLRRVGQFPRVRSLMICSQQVRGQELRTLPFFLELEDLTVQCPEFTDEDAQIFRDLKQPELVGIGSNQLSDAGLAALKNRRGLQTLSIRAPRVTDDGFAFIPLGPDLRVVRLLETSVGDGTLARLATGTPSLNFLGLRGTRITDAGLVHLQSLRQLNHLDLSGTAITDAGLPTIAQIHSLRSLDLSKTAVTDEGLTLLASLPNLDSLDLSDTRVTDRTIEALQDNPIPALFLNDTRVGNVTLGILAGWPKMSELELRRTQVTAEGLRRFAEKNVPASIASEIDPDLWYPRKKADS